MGRLRKYRLVIVAAGSFLAGALVTSAVGDLSSGTGGAVTRVKVATGSDLTFMNEAVGFKRLTGASVLIAVPSSGGLLTARFTAMSKCSSDSGGACAIRISAQRGASTRRMLPFGDNTFDSAPIGAAAPYALLQARAIERSLRVGGGVWKVFVDLGITSEGTLFTLSSWHLTVERS